MTSGHLPGLRPPGSDGGDGAGAWPGGARSRLAGWALLELPAPGSACLLGGGEGGRPPPPLAAAWGLISARPPHRWACWCVVFHTEVPLQLELVRREEGDRGLKTLALLKTKRMASSF